MCAISAWQGDLPEGLLTHWIRSMSVRGVDSTGIAYRRRGATEIHKAAVSPHEFVKTSQDILSLARRNKKGIIHTRRASAGMPVVQSNAHPFRWGQNLTLAHNGYICNWEAIRSSQAKEFSGELRSEIEGFTVDSMVLGPAIERSDFGSLVGSIGLVWLDRGTVYAIRSAKELVSGCVKWKKPNGKEGSFSFFCSTGEILSEALGKLTMRGRISTYAIKFSPLEEGVLTELTKGKSVKVSKMKFNSSNAADKFTSASRCV